MITISWPQVNVPAPVGMICAGLFLKNVPASGPNQARLLRHRLLLLAALQPTVLVELQCREFPWLHQLPVCSWCPNIMNVQNCQAALAPFPSCHAATRLCRRLCNGACLIPLTLLCRARLQGCLIWGLKPRWSTEIRAAALAVIFLRSGLEIDLSVRARTGADKLACGPYHVSSAACVQ